VIVGGGVTGLVAAHDLERLSNADITLYEASTRLGGKLETDQIDGFLVERGPDCFFRPKGGVMDLVCDLGLEEEIVAPCQTSFAMLIGGCLHAVPRELLNLRDVSPFSFGSFPPLSNIDAKPQPPSHTAHDTSIRAFFTHRYGSEFSRMIAEPLLAGTHGGDANLLSMRALYPAFLDPASIPAGQDRGPTFLSFRNGMQTFVDALAKSLARTRVLLGSPFDEAEADHFLFTVPSTASHCFASLAPEAAELAGKIPHRSSTIVTCAYSRDQIGKPIDLTGFLVPEGEHDVLAGATFSSEKWPGRAPDGTVLLRAFLRADTEKAEDSLQELLEISGVPMWKHTSHWEKALPQYEIGHLDLVDSVERALPENVHLAGTSYRGVGVPDCIRQGREAARRIAQKL
jgi:oxygen-dependent protoporphyrinogen oxidase